VSYSLAMAGAHRSTIHTPVRSALKSAAWLTAGVGLVGVPLGVLAVGIYFAVADRTGGLLSTAGLQGVCCLLALAGPAVLLRKGSYSVANVDQLIGSAFLLLVCSVGLLINIGGLQGWINGTPEYVLAGIDGLLVVAMSAYCLGGKRRLLAALNARVASKKSPS
jgi:hypothetical protein